MTDAESSDIQSAETDNFGGEVGNGIKVVASIVTVLVIAFIGIVIVYCVWEADDREEEKK